MPWPSSPTLLGAARWIHELRDSNQEHAYNILRSAPRYSDLTPTQYGVAFEWLQTTGLLSDSTALHLPEHLVRLELLRSAIDQSSPSWLADSDLLVRIPDDLPSDVDSAAEALDISGVECLQIVGECRNRLDLEARSRLGAAGEEALMALLRQHTRGRVTQVSKIADSFGYDILWEGSDGEFALEVKTTNRRGRLTVHISRHEFETSRRHQGWCLIVLHLDEADGITAIATVERSWLDANTPRDGTSRARWDAASLSPPPAALAPGCPTPAVGSGPGHDLLAHGTVNGRRSPEWMPVKKSAGVDGG